MQPDSPRHPEGGPEPSAGEPQAPDPLEALSDRLRQAQETAERLVREASEEARRSTEDPPPPPPGSSAGRPPPRGYAVPEDEGRGRSTTADLQALVGLLDLGRTLVPPELREQIGELVRELLLLVRAIIDWYLERLDRQRKAQVEVEDIPIS
jgi:hypothetical protein